MSDIGCSCEIDIGLDDIAEPLIEKYGHTAPRECECSECKCQIAPGEIHNFFVYINNPSHMPDIFRYRTCEDCDQLIGVFFHDWIFGQVSEMLHDNIIEEDIGISEDCISGLSPRNMNLVCQWVEKLWKYQEAENV